MAAQANIKLLLAIVFISILSVVGGLAFANIMALEGNGAIIAQLTSAAILSLILGLPVLAMYFKPFTRLIAQLNGRSTNSASGPLDIEGNSYVERLCVQLNGLLQHDSGNSGELTKATNELSFTASALSDVTERTSANIIKQQQETEQVATAMNEMSTTVDEVARNASEASVAAGQANDAASSGENVARNSKSSIDTLVNDINDASNVVSQLEQQSTDITVVLEVIKGIAEQTNLLALNAAIEAARAGEQGRGFAVVADEVRSLANRTQQSAQEIDEMISNLQGGVRASVTAMESALNKGRDSSEKVDATLQSLGEIYKAVTTINDMNAQIATAAEEQSSVANEINRNVSAISQLADATTQDASASRETSVTIAGISQHLNTLVSQMDSGGDKSLDLSSAKAAHLNWKTRLRSFLDGESTLSADQAVSHHHCDFGKWYYSDGLQHFGHLQAIKDVERPHEELHELIRMIIDYKNNGRTQEAEEAYQQVATISGEIVHQLDLAEQQASY